MVLAQLLAFLGLQAEGRGGPQQQALQADGQAGLLAVAVVALVDPPQGLGDLAQQPCLAVGLAQQQARLLLDRRAVEFIAPR
nr:hypothetical protein [Halomonas kalidii]